MKIIKTILHKGEWLLDALKRMGCNMIPTNTILNKTLTGLGATHSEIHSKRNSIIIEPNVPVILGKLNENENLEAVYEKCTPYKIEKYLKMDIPYKKIITTPESFPKIRKAAQKFRQVVSLDSFEDEDADVIFHYLYKEMELVSFGDYLKRYVYERAELEEPFSQVPQEVYREIVVESFKETYTPKSMSPTSAKLSSLVNNWLTQASVKRETVFLLGFGLRMSTEDVSDFLTRVLREQDFDFHNPEEVIYWYCYRNHLGYYKAEEYKETYKQMTPVEKKTGEIVYGTGLCLDSEEKLLEYLAFLKGRHDDPCRALCPLFLRQPAGGKH